MVRTKHIQVYKFSELKADVQEKVIGENQELNTDSDWYSFLYEDFHEELKKIGVECNTFYFDLYDKTFRMDTPTLEDYNLLFNKALTKKEQIIIGLEKDEEEYKEIEIIERGNVSVLNLKSDKYDKALEEKLTTFLKNKLYDFLKRLETEHEYLISDEAIKETIEANEYEFLDNGERA